VGGLGGPGADRAHGKGFTGCQVSLVYNKVSYANRSRVSIHLQ